MRKNVVIYTSNYINGEIIKATLEEKDIDFIEKNVSNDINARNEIILKGIRKLPAVKINNKYYDGLSVQSLFKNYSNNPN